MLSTIQLARAQARDRASTARGELTGTELPGSRAADQTIAEVVIDLDATLVSALTWVWHTFLEGETPCHLVRWHLSACRDLRGNQRLRKVLPCKPRR